MKITSSTQILRARSKLLRSMREFFIRRGFAEVQTPCLSAYPCNEAHLTPLSVDGQSRTPNQSRSLSGWLRASPESAMKRLLARTELNIFQVAPVFRGGETGRTHRQEFTMLEWYRVDIGWRELLDDCLALLRKCGLKYNQLTRITWLEWVEAHYGENLLSMPEDRLRELAAHHQLQNDQSRAVMAEFLFEKSVAQFRYPQELLVVTHYPRAWAINARYEGDWSSRFECFYQGMELINGCVEINDPNEQEQRFVEQNAIRKDRGLPVFELDRCWLTEISEMPACAGAALGVDRLLMAVRGVDNIADIDPLNHPLAAESNIQE